METLTTHALDTTRAPVACPGCDKSRPATAGLYLCSSCGTWFTVKAE